MAEPTIGVCGFGRCGSTMAMAMLDAGGCPPAPGSASVSYELEDPSVVHGMSAEVLAGRAVKLLDSTSHLGVPPAPVAWRFVWIDRDPVEQARSAVKFMTALLGDGALTTDAVEVLAASYRNDRPRMLGLLRKVAGPDHVVILQYERVLAAPRRAARHLAQLWPTLDIHAAAAVVHDRDGSCRPDLSFELGAIGAPT